MRRPPSAWWLCSEWRQWTVQHAALQGHGEWLQRLHWLTCMHDYIEVRCLIPWQLASVTEMKAMMRVAPRQQQALQEHNHQPVSSHPHHSRNQRTEAWHDSVTEWAVAWCEMNGARMHVGIAMVCGQAHRM